MTIDDQTSTQLSELIRRILIDFEAVAVLCKALGFDTSECIDVVLGEVAVEVEDIRSCLDDQLIREACPYTSDTTTIACRRTYILEALEERVLDGVGRLEVQVIGEVYLCIDSSNTTKCTELSRIEIWIEYLKWIVSSLQRGRTLIV